MSSRCASSRRLLPNYLFPCHEDRIQECLHRCFSVAVFLRVRALLVDLTKPRLKIDLEFIDRAIDHRPECHLVELVQNRPLEPFTDSEVLHTGHFFLDSPWLSCYLDL